jgi:hypothetical protein
VKLRDRAADFVEELFAFLPPTKKVRLPRLFGCSGENEVADLDVIYGAVKA